MVQRPRSHLTDPYRADGAAAVKAWLAVAALVLSVGCFLGSSFNGVQLKNEYVERNDVVNGTQRCWKNIEQENKEK